jgi:hypothetical protein
LFSNFSLVDTLHCRWFIPMGYWSMPPVFVA